MAYVTRTNSQQGEVLILTPTNPNNGPIDQRDGYFGILEYSDAIAQALPGRDEVGEISARAAGKNVKRSGITALVWLSDQGNGQVGVNFNSRPGEEDEPDVVIPAQAANVIFGIVPGEGVVQKVAVTKVSNSVALTQAGLANLNVAAQAAGLDNVNQGAPIPVVAQPITSPADQPVDEDEEGEENEDWRDDDEDEDYDENENEEVDADIDDFVAQRDYLRMDVIDNVDCLIDVLQKIKRFIQNPTEGDLPQNDDIALIGENAGSIVYNLGMISGINLAANQAGIEKVTQFNPLN